MREQGLERFALLASAIAGRLVDVGPAEPEDQAWTDGVTIFVEPDASTSQQLQCIVVQAALLGAGSLDADVVPRLGRRQALARRYLTVEGHRVLAAQKSLLPLAVRSLIDPMVVARSDSPATSLAVAASREVIPEPPPAFGVIRPRRVRVADDGSHDPAVEQHVPRRQRDEALRQLDETGDDEEDVISLDFLMSPSDREGPLGRLLKRLLSATRSRSAGPPGAEAPTHWTQGAARTAGAATPTTAKASRLDGAADVETTGVHYPEWDVFKRRYRANWCTVIEATPETGDDAIAVPDTHSLRRSLARLGMGLERRHRQLQGDEVDIDAAVEAHVEVAAGSAPDEGVYVDTVRGRRDLSALVLLDVSGSAGEPSATGVPVHEHQRATAAALTMTLHELGDRVALYAFRSQGRSAVHVLPLKRFDSPLDALVLRRLGGLVPGAYTRLGAAIRHGTWLLERDGGTENRLLVVLSDGFAYDHGYEGAYGEADARRALAEARQRGTGCLCLSVGAATDVRALGRVFGTAAHATVPRTDQLSGVVGPLFRSALQSAEAKRLVSQRRERTRERLELERRSA